MRSILNYESSADDEDIQVYKDAAFIYINEYEEKSPEDYSVFKY